MGPDELDLDAYLGRTGARAPLAPSAEALADLQQAHVGAVPFENLDILLGRPIALDLESLQAKLVTARRGGYCFEQNTLFQAALETMGFEVTALAARVRVGATGIRARTHMLLRVDLPEGPFVADVGFGADGPVRSLPLRGRTESTGSGPRDTASGGRAISGCSRGTLEGSGPTSTPSPWSPSTPSTSRWPTTSPAPTPGRPS